MKKRQRPCALYAHDAVDFAEPNWPYQRAAVSNGARYNGVLGPPS